MKLVNRSPRHYVRELSFDNADEVDFISLQEGPLKCKVC